MHDDAPPGVHRALHALERVLPTDRLRGSDAGDGVVGVPQGTARHRLQRRQRLSGRRGAQVRVSAQERAHPDDQGLLGGLVRVRWGGRVEPRVGGLGGEGERSGQRRPAHGADRVQVRAHRDALLLAQDLRGDEARGAAQVGHAVGGQGEAEVEQGDAPVAPVGQDVVGLQIPVHPAPVMDEADRLEQPGQEDAQQRGAEGRHLGAEGLTAGDVHREPGPAVAGEPHVQHSDRAGVLEQAEEAELSGAVTGREQLDRYIGAEEAIPDAPDRAPGAGPQPRHDGIARSQPRMLLAFGASPVPH